MSTLVYGPESLARIRYLTHADTADLILASRANVRDFERSYPHKPKPRAVSAAKILALYEGWIEDPARLTRDHVTECVDDLGLLRYNCLPVGSEESGALDRIEARAFRMLRRFTTGGLGDVRLLVSAWAGERHAHHHY